MKNMYITVTVILFLTFLLMPLIAVERENIPDNSITEKKDDTKSGLEYIKEFVVYLKSEDKKEKIQVDEYLTGVLAAEISAEYNSEALKAQALAAYTYAYRKTMQNTANDYDITDDFSLDQGYLNKEKREKKWEEKAEVYEKKVKSAVNEILGKLIVYNDEPILAVYHAISAGKTETAENIWGSDYAYLQSENSIGDLLAPDYLSEVTVKKEDFENSVKELGCNVSGEAETYVGKSEKTSAGTVIKISICGKELSGTDIRSKFSLRSAAFDVVYKNESFVFTVSGYGHGVGMSQFGANYMAEQGSDFKEILLTYYRGVSIINL